MELVKQFGCFVMFGSIFPMAGFVYLMTNYFLIYMIKKEMTIKKRTIPQISIGLGQFNSMISILSHLSLVVNVAILYFTSDRVKKAIISDTNTTHEVCLGFNTTICAVVPIQNKLLRDTADFALNLSFIEHIVFFLKRGYEKLKDDNKLGINMGDRINDIIKKTFVMKLQFHMLNHQEDDEKPSLYNPMKVPEKKRRKINYMWNHYDVNPLKKNAMIKINAKSANQELLKVDLFP